MEDRDQIAYRPNIRPDDDRSPWQHALHLRDPRNGSFFLNQLPSSGLSFRVKASAAGCRGGGRCPSGGMFGDMQSGGCGGAAANSPRSESGGEVNSGGGAPTPSPPALLRVLEPLVDPGHQVAE